MNQIPSSSDNITNIPGSVYLLELLPVRIARQQLDQAVFSIIFFTTPCERRIRLNASATTANIAATAPGILTFDLCRAGCVTTLAEKVSHLQLDSLRLHSGKRPSSK